MSEATEKTPTRTTGASKNSPTKRPFAATSRSSGDATGQARKSSTAGRGRRRERRDTYDRRPEFAQKIISIRRVTRVMAGGRRFSFSVAMVLGDKKGRVGLGTGKAGDTALAIEKAIRKAKKQMVTLSLTKNNSIPHDVAAKYGASSVEIRPAKGRGLVAGSSARTVLELGGVKDITAKVETRSKNKVNIARATLAALASLEV